MLPATQNRNKSRFGRKPFWKSLLYCKHTQEPRPGLDLAPTALAPEQTGIEAKDPAQGLTRQESGSRDGQEEAQDSWGEKK